MLAIQSTRYLLSIGGLIGLTAILACREAATFGSPLQSPAAGSGAAGAKPAASGAGTGMGAAGRASAAAGSSAAGSGAMTMPGSRAQDSRMFTIDEAGIMFAPPAPAAEADRYTGVLDGAGFMIEVPKNWNGILVMYAHGYVGAGPALRLTTPSVRRYLVENGYAWAASSYTKNYYDVRVGVEDTNKLALNFKKLVNDRGRVLDEPTKRYLIGHSMGGHITGAAIEKEALDTANNRVQYAAALPMCGVMGDTDLFNYFAAFQFAAHQLAGTPVVVTSAADFMMNARQATQDALFSMYPSQTTDAGAKLRTTVAHLTGGPRPIFDLGFAVKTWQDAVWSTFGGDGTINGILEAAVTDTREIVYQLDDDPAQSDAERTFNMMVHRATPKEGANGLRKDGLRWIPKVNGEFSIPVLSMHTLGDLYVPFRMQQIYRERANAKGNGERLVQRVVRGVGHCEFSVAEQVAAFEALAKWEQEGVKPEGDDVLDPKVISSPTYGCAFTKNTFTPEEMAAATVTTSRATTPACP
jgi:pimeloyl-ACP methyl ester carboxylesterase